MLEYKKRSFHNNINRLFNQWLFNRHIRLFIFLLACCEAISIRILVSNEVSFNDLLILELYGCTNGEFVLQQYIFVMIYDMVAIFIMSSFWGKCKQCFNYTIIYRLKSKEMLMRRVLFAIIKFNSLYVVIKAGVYVLFAYITSNQLNSYIITNYMEYEILSNWSVGSILLFYISSKIVELTVMFLIVVFIDSFNEKGSYGFLCLVIGHVVNILPFKIIIYNPIGISYLGRMMSRYDNNITPKQIAIVLMITCFTCGALVYKRRDNIITI